MTGGLIIALLLTGLVGVGVAQVLGKGRAAQRAVDLASACILVALVVAGYVLVVTVVP